MLIEWVLTHYDAKVNMQNKNIEVKELFFQHPALLIFSLLFPLHSNQISPKSVMEVWINENPNFGPNLGISDHQHH